MNNWLVAGALALGGVVVAKIIKDKREEAAREKRYQDAVKRSKTMKEVKLFEEIEENIEDEEKDEDK